MKLLVKMFDRQQTGFDGCQFAVFLLSFATLILSGITGQSYSMPDLVPAFLLVFGLCLLILDFLYVAASVVFTRGNWRQYGVYVIGAIVGAALFFILFLPSLARAKE